MTDCVKVAVRPRPFNAKERAEGASECLQYFVEKNQIAINGRYFAYDLVFDPSCSQQGVYEACAAPLLEKLFSGYNCTVIAYGQTGSGKTYTIGTEETEESLVSENRGVIPRFVDAIFRQADNSTAYAISVSMLEVYEEKILDLLSCNKEPLSIREKDGETFVQGLTFEPVYDLTSTMRELEKGGRMRSKGETAMNLKSSRSHAIFTLVIDKAPTEHNETSFKSKLSIVDLAGSERLKKTMAEGERLKEGIKINSGLLALGNVISALVEQGPNSGHIPYRDSKITRLLQDSLGGNSFTVMIACVSPADSNAEETISTLRYADRAKKIRNKPVVNTDPNLAIIQELREQLAAAKHELALYRTGEHEVQNEVTATLRFEDLNRRDGLERKYNELLAEHRHTRIQLADAVAESMHTYSQLVALEDDKERLKEALEKARSRLREKLDTAETGENFDDIFELLAVSQQNLGSPQAEDEDEDEQDPSMDERMDEEDTDDAGGVDSAFPTRFADNQRKLANLLEEIKNKEKAVEATLATEQEIQKMREQHLMEVEQLKTKLDEMQEERNELMAKLRGNTNQTKVSEQRRKRVQELEKEIALNRKRLAEITKLEKEKAELQERARKLASELIELKKIRVKMARQMKDEEAKFRTWKVKAEKEMVQIKNRERKREAVMARAAAMSKQQLAVYRQKYEEASACNRRLQQQLCAAAKRKDTDRSGEQINAFLDQELELAFSAAEAEVHCNVLIEQRKILSAQHRRLMVQLKKLSERPPSKRRTGSDRSSIDNETEVNRLREQIVSLEEEIDLRNTELQDIQQKCAKADDDVRSDQRWNNVRTLVSARAALKRMFDVIIAERRDAFDKERAVEELKRMEVEASRKLDELRVELEEEKKKSGELEKALTRMERLNAEKLLSLTAAHGLGAFKTEPAVQHFTEEEAPLKPVSRVRRSSRRKKSEEPVAQIVYCSQPSSSLAKGDFADIDEDEDIDINDVTYDKNDHTYYPTPERRALRKHLRLIRNSPPANRRESFFVQKPVQMSSSEDGPNPLSDRNEQVNAEHNATFTIDRKGDDDEKIPASLLSSSRVNSRHNASVQLQRITKDLFQGF